MDALWLKAQGIAKENYEEAYGKGAWAYANRFEREDYCMSVYENLKKENNSTKLNKEGKIMNKRDERIETLKVNGIDVGKYFDVTLPGGGTMRMTLKDGVPVVADDDPIMDQIIKNGYVRNSKLHRRWVMAQMFKMLNNERTRYNASFGRPVVYGTGYDDCLRYNYPYHYQFTMMLEEIRVISKLEKSGDKETFRERTSFFNKDVVTIVCGHYLNDLKMYIETIKIKKCKGIPYKRVPKYGDIFVADLNRKLYSKFEYSIHRMKYSINYTDLYRELKVFIGMMIKLPYHTAKSKVWIDAFKGSGAFYTLLNLTMYHNCKIIDEPKRSYYWHREKKEPVTYAAGIEATNFVKSKLDEYKGQGWRYMAMLKKCIADNNFDFEAAMKEIYNSK